MGNSISREDALEALKALYGVALKPFPGSRLLEARYELVRDFIEQERKLVSDLEELVETYRPYKKRVRKPLDISHWKEPSDGTTEQEYNVQDDYQD